jgi:hypothetical protein
MHNIEYLLACCGESEIIGMDKESFLFIMREIRRITTCIQIFEDELLEIKHRAKRVSAKVALAKLRDLAPDCPEYHLIDFILEKSDFFWRKVSVKEYSKLISPAWVLRRRVRCEREARASKQVEFLSKDPVVSSVSELMVPVGFEGSPSEPIVSEASRVESDKVKIVKILLSQKADLKKPIVTIEKERKENSKIHWELRYRTILWLIQFRNQWFQ